MQAYREQWQPVNSYNTLGVLVNDVIGLYRAQHFLQL